MDHLKKCFCQFFLRHLEVFHFCGPGKLLFEQEVLEQRRPVVEMRQEQLLDGVGRLRVRQDLQEEGLGHRLGPGLFGLEHD